MTETHEVYRIRLEDIIDTIDAADDQGNMFVVIEVPDARWLVETIDRLQQQVNGLADLLAEAAGIQEGE